MARRADGLGAGHGWAIIAVEEVDGLFKLLRLRNPCAHRMGGAREKAHDAVVPCPPHLEAAVPRRWGRLEWKGEWAREDSAWEQHPRVAQQARGHSLPGDRGHPHRAGGSSSSCVPPRAQVSTSCLTGDDGDFWMPFDRFCATFSGARCSPFS